MKSLRRFRLRGGGGDDAEHDAPARNVSAAGPLSAPFDEAEAANRGELRFKHVLMNLGEGPQRQEGAGTGRRNNVNEAARQHSHNNNLRGGSERARRAKSPLLDTVRVSVVAPPSKSAPPSSPSSPTSLRRRGRARRKWDGPSRDNRQGLQQLQVQRRGGSSTTADTSDASSPRQRADAKGEKNLEVVPPSSLTRHLAAACDVMKEVNDGMMCHPNDVSGMTADTSFDDSRDGQREVATPRRHGGRPEDSKVIAPGNAQANVPTGRPEKAQAHPPGRRTGLPPEYGGDYDSALGWEAGQEVKLGGGGARTKNVPRHDHDYRPLPPQRRSGKPAKSQKKEQQKVQEEKQAKQKKEQQKKEKAQAAKGERSQSVPKARVRSPPPAVTPSPPSAKSRALPEAKEQKRTEQKVQGKQQPKSALRTGQPSKQPQQPAQKRPPERPRPKSAPPRRPGTAVDAPESTTPSAAPTAKMANSSSKLLGRLLRRHRKPAMEPEEEWSGKERGKEEGGAEEPVRVSVIYNSARSGPAPPVEPPKVRRIKEEPKEGALARQYKPGGQPGGQPGGRRPDPPAAYRHMQSTVEQPTATGKKTPPAAQRHMPSTVDPTAPSSTAQRPNPQNAPPPPKRPAPPPPSKVKSHRRPPPDHYDMAPDEWKAPLPFKKVNSTPSNFSSFFTRQSSRSSQFWEGVEEFPDPAYPKKRLFDNDIQAEGGEDVEMTKEGAAEYFRQHAVDVQKEKLGDGRRNASGAKSPPRRRGDRGLARRPRGSPRASPAPPPSEVSNAFSLQLPLNRHGNFDDSDISALRMHDSATVYFQQQQRGGEDDAGTPESEYWKRKYDLLREEMEGAAEGAERRPRSTAEAEHEEMQRVALARKIDRRAEDRRTPLSTDARGSPTAGPSCASVQETHDEPTYDETLGSLGETYDETLRTDDNSMGETYDETVGTDGDGTRTEWGRRCASPLDALHELWDGVVDLDHSEFDPPRCNDYRGGKKGREQAARWAAQCSAGSQGAGLTPRELDRIAAAAQSRIEGAAVRCASQLEEARKQRGPGGGAPRYQRVCAATDLAEEGLGSARLSEASPPVDRERETHEETGTLDTDDFDLRPAGYVPREGTPTGAPSEATDPSSENDAARPSHCRERRAGRPSPKSLADDLTAGPSRLSLPTTDAADDDRSELSENARLIFEAALPRGAADWRGPRGRPRSVYSVARSPSKLLSAAAESNGANVPPDFATWYELPSPGTQCLPLLPVGDAAARNALGACDAEDVPSRVVADDAAALAFGDFCRAAKEMAGEGTTGLGLGEGVNVGPLVVGDDGAVRFADGAATLPDISAAAVVALSRRRCEDAAAIYNALLRSCRASAGATRGLAGQLLASTLHNLGVLHLWNQEYDRALPCCREALRVRAALGGDDAGCVRLWANLGLANYALGSFASALAAFRKAGQLSSQYIPANGALAGRLANNQAVVNFEIGKVPLVQSQFRRSLQLQRGTSSSPDVDADAEDLFSISITIFNVGVVCARQAQHASAASHLQACLAIQRALLGGDDAVVRSTAHYLDSARERAPAKSPAPGDPLGAQLNNEQSPPQAVMPAQPTAHARGRNPRSAPAEQGTSTSNSQITAPSGRRQISHSKGAQQSSQSQRQQVASRILKGAQSGQAGPGQTSQPMLSLGSLRAEATAAQRVQQSLEGCADSLALQGVGKGRNVSQLLCQRPAPVPARQTISQSVLNFGLQTMKKREGEAELQRNLERYGPRHPLAGESHRRLGLFHLHARNYPEAVAHLRSACRILGHALGEKHPDVASAVTFKGLAQLACERPDDALASFRQVRRLREKELGRRHPEMGRILNNLACVHYEMGDAARAEALLQEALDLQREVFTTAPAFLTGVSTVLCNIAFLHAKAGAFPKALIELEGALQIRQDILLEDNALGITKNMAHILAISQLQHGAVDLDEVTEEYVAMLRQSGAGR